MNGDQMHGSYFRKQFFWSETQTKQSLLNLIDKVVVTLVLHLLIDIKEQKGDVCIFILYIFFNLYLHIGGSDQQWNTLNNYFVKTFK